jgi:hypothetical protein
VGYNGGHGTWVGWDFELATAAMMPVAADRERRKHWYKDLDKVAAYTRPHKGFTHGCPLSYALKRKWMSSGLELAPIGD